MPFDIATRRTGERAPAGNLLSLYPDSEPHSMAYGGCLVGLIDGSGNWFSCEKTVAALRRQLDRVYEVLQGAADPLSLLEEALRIAGLECYNERSRGQPESTIPEDDGFMPVCATVAWITEDHYWAVHVGVSRLYLLRDGGVEQLSRDHSLMAEQIEAGLKTREEAKMHPARHIITQALGSRSEIELQLIQGTVRTGDLFLLISGHSAQAADSEDLDRYIRGCQSAPDLVDRCKAIWDVHPHPGAYGSIAVAHLTP